MPLLQHVYRFMLKFLRNACLRLMSFANRALSSRRILSPQYGPISESSSAVGYGSLLVALELKSIYSLRAIAGKQVLNIKLKYL